MQLDKQFRPAESSPELEAFGKGLSARYLAVSKKGNELEPRLPELWVRSLGNSAMVARQL